MRPRETDLSSTDNLIRLQLRLSRCGVASRRASEKLILQGRVTVNGSVVTELGTKVCDADVVRVDGEPISLEERRVYLALHKPEGYICSSSDPQGRPLAITLLASEYSERLYSIGRLDLRSSGLILFTNDGEFARAVSHPSAEVEKEYLVDSSVPISDSMLEDFRKGVEIEGELYRCQSIQRLGLRSVKIVLIEGKNREIRRVFSAFHLHPTRLHRVRIGRIQLGDLEVGQHRVLSEAEVKSLYTGCKGKET